MQRPHFRHPHQGSGPRTPGFRSPPPAFDRTGNTFPSPPWAFSTPPPPFGPRFGQGSPNTPPREFFGNRGGSGGKYFSGQSPGLTPRRTNPSPRGAPYRRSPYGSAGRYAGHHQGSQRTSTPFGSTHGREKGTDDMESYYKPSMLQDPWADLKPISVTETQSKCSSQQTTNTGKEDITIKNKYISKKCSVAYMKPMRLLVDSLFYLVQCLFLSQTESTITQTYLSWTWIRIHQQ